jgi:regulator of replication initiation timing
MSGIDDVQKLQAQVGNLRQQVGVLEGKLDALRTENARYADEAVQARDRRDQRALSLTDAAANQKALTASGQRNRQEPRARAVARWVNRRGHAKPDLSWNGFREDDARFSVRASCTRYKPMSSSNQRLRTRSARCVAGSANLIPKAPSGPTATHPSYIVP